MRARKGKKGGAVNATVPAVTRVGHHQQQSLFSHAELLIYRKRRKKALALKPWSRTEDTDDAS